MEKKSAAFIKNMAYTLSSNFISFGVNALIVLLIPKLIGVREYGYFQLYTLLAAYSLYCHFGWCDGIYLRNVGKKREELDKESLSAQYKGVWLMSSVLWVFISLGAVLFTGDSEKLWVYLAAAAAVLLASPKIYSTVLCQALSCMKHYSAVIIAERAVYALILAAMLIAGVRDFRLLILGDIIGKISAVAVGAYYCRDILSVKSSPDRLKEYFRDSCINIGTGVFLLVSNISSVLITGIVQLAAESRWSIETFSKVSLTFNLSKLLLVAVNAAGAVLIPVLKNTDEKRLGELYGHIRSLLMAVLGFMLAFYVPLRAVMLIWLPQYKESLDYMALLFPMCLFESKTSLLLNTYLKALRREKVLCAVNTAVVAVSAAVSWVLVFAVGSLDAAVTAIPCLLALRAALLELAVSRQLKIKTARSTVTELFLAAAFMLLSRCIGSWLSVVLYLCVFGVYVFLDRKNLAAAVASFKEMRKL